MPSRMQCPGEMARNDYGETLARATASRYVSRMSTQTTPEKPYTSGDVAQLFGVDSDTVARWANAGRLPHFRTPSGHRRFHRADIDALVATLSDHEGP